MSPTVFREDGYRFYFFSRELGINTSQVEVTNISPHGLWLLLENEELFVPFCEFPWFQEASIAKIFYVEYSFPNHLYWPDLDIDLSVESIRNPNCFPLMSQVGNPKLNERVGKS